MEDKEILWLEEKLKEEIKKYMEILSLSQEERELIKRKEMGELTKVLIKKEEIIREIGEIEKEIKGIADKAVDYPKIKTSGQNLAQIIMQVFEWEKENQKLLLSAIDNVKGKLQDLQTLKKIPQTYRLKEYQTRFIDKKK